MKKYSIFLALIGLLSCQNQDNKNNTIPQKEATIQKPLKPQTPIMGWSSWNNFRVNINEDIIKAQADYMVSSGMVKVGYSYVNIDDGFFAGRDKEGNLKIHTERFPNGMKAVSDYIHSKGLKAGIYSDAGINTCASYWDKDTIGSGSGLYGHDRKDLTLMLKEWNYDFIKVDWCGGDWMNLDEETRYTQIANVINEVKPSTVYNICRWEFPGKWAPRIADSWRISGDITNQFHSILHIIDLNADLWKYASPGHVNDMDMLQVGRGMSYEEDKAHFSMWCMMNSPLLAGNDLRNMSKETIEILTNEELIALNQDPLVYQARRLVDHGDLEVWAKPLVSTMDGKVAVALLNRSNKAATISFDLDIIGIDETKGYTYRNLWEKKDYPQTNLKSLSFQVPKHGVVVLSIEGTSKPFNIFQYK
ncbi:glycoside hydrolase family 27 protein [Aestuariibaculum sp. M13]|uniref:glycoside hydrolase family 27 protein n=1 Tax=Aestuariibaculum sp. M13 TaxID=2967132 RepID=UPI002159F723|nr:glycoside hydrolase family 27 protein [Aestuariibaculum sp. M13]MCR8668715.1 glycoside hydrolase family 27 protein [Aestuariibaculum sp. M13]